MSDKEIEIKLTYEDRTAVEEKLVSLGAKKLEPTSLADIYYSLTATSMENVNDIVRIRNKNGKCELTLKGKCKDTDGVWERVELNVGIDNPETMSKMLDMLNFSLLKENASSRQAWMLDDVEVMFIDFTKPAPLSLLEVEGPSAEKVESVVAKLGPLVKKAGEEIFASFDKKK
jgi:predicted adenylyl cyclase CyaB